MLEADAVTRDIRKNLQDNSLVIARKKIVCKFGHFRILYAHIEI
jgi:hypothetical protein